MDAYLIGSLELEKSAGTTTPPILIPEQGDGIRPVQFRDQLTLTNNPCIRLQKRL